MDDWGGFVRQKPPAATAILLVIYASDRAVTEQKVKVAVGSLV